MKKGLRVILLSFFVVLLAFSSIFSNKRNATRGVTGVLIELDESLGLLTKASIKRSLQEMNQFQQDDVPHREVNLLSIEDHIKSLNGVENAQAFFYPDGVLGLKVQSRRPLYEVVGPQSYFVDAYGIKIENQLKFDIDAPIYVGPLNQEVKMEVTNLFKRFDMDNFYRNELDTIISVDQIYKLKLKSYPFDVVLGSSKSLNQKLKKLKVFCIYKSANAQDLDEIREISLQYDGQVIVRK